MVAPVDVPAVEDGDAALPPAERITVTNIRVPFSPDTPLLESGLLGPVRLVPTGDHSTAWTVISR